MFTGCREAHREGGCWVLTSFTGCFSRLWEGDVCGDANPAICKDLASNDTSVLAV